MGKLNKRRGIGFKSKKQEEKFDKVLHRLQSRWSTFSIKAEHDYVKREHNYDIRESRPSLSDIADDIIIDEAEPRTDLEWMRGRRVVELGVIAEGLRACHNCGTPLHLSHCTGIITYGLGAILKVPCSNTNCHHINKIPTGKKHDKVWDANTKLATAMVHTGMSATQVNNFLACVNIPPVSNRLLNERMKEAGQTIEEIAEESMTDSLLQETLLTQKNHGTEAITASVDAGWQKRGSGRSYDSLSGHCSMIGAETGRVINYAVRSKSCRVCENAAKSNSTPVAHDCRRNYDGSAKSMESDMVVSMVKDMKEKGIKTATIVADDDSTTMCRLRAESGDISKESDRNHVRKNFSSALHSLQREHKALSTKVIKYISKCFNYAISQNKGNPDGLDKALGAITNHAFGDHDNCNESWCVFISNPDSRYKSLPFGRPLTCGSLKLALEQLFGIYRKQSKKLAFLGSTQGNEAFNKIVSSKAPKSLHLSGSANLNYRVASSVAQKNQGHEYLLRVHEKIGLSPGKFTRRRLIINDIIKAKNKAIARTREARKRRLKLKLERGKKSSSAELREGTTYQPGIDLSESDAVDVEAIPPPCYPPVEKPPLAKGAYVYFDLEATGLERDSHITQIAALDEESDECFCSYIIPKKPISVQASRVTGLRIKENTMYHNGMAVPAESIHEVLRGFISFLDNLPSDQQKILVGHNIKSYDCLVLMHALRSCGMVDDFHQQVIGYMDTRKLFRLSFPSQKSFSQINLSRALLVENFTYAAHDAMEDVRTLKKLVLLPSVSSSDKELCEFSTTYITESINHNTRVKANLPTLQVLINQKVLTAAMARNIAGSNLSFHHLEVVFRRNGQEGLLTLLSETVSGRVRVSKSKKLITSLCDYFSK